MITFSSAVCGNLSPALAREWIETNGLGGFASSTIIGLNTRRYHGLLIAADHPPVGRVALLSKLEETLIVDGRRYELSANQYPGVIHPQGHLFQTGFRLDPFPVFSYSVEDITLEKTVFMVQGENTTVVIWRANGVGGRAVGLEVRPLVAFRDYHSITHENQAFGSEWSEKPGVVEIHPYTGLPALYLAHNASRVGREGYWYRNFEYQAEQERGFDFREDLYNPLVFEFDLAAQPETTVIASTEERDAHDGSVLKEREQNRRHTLVPAALVSDEFACTLTEAASQFLVRRDSFETVIAGYHWFGDWGRDTMIALPGLALSTGRPEVARNLLKVFAAHADQGLLPNRFTEQGAAEYNSIDASLWYFEAVRVYLEKTHDSQFVRQNLYPVLRDMISWHERGTRYGIHVAPDGLLEGGGYGLQLTWMDVKIGDFVVTPRSGKPVEIQALWYNALCTMEVLARDFGDSSGSAHYAEASRRTKASFDLVFWNDAEQCLYDVIDGELRDGSIRPNQIFTVSLFHPLLEGERARSVVDRVERELLTPYGLRTLSPLDPRYRGRYENDARSRDTAYHQGTVWAWLMGPFIRAYRAVYGHVPETSRRIDSWLSVFRDHLHDAGLGQISEIFDGDPPYTPRGCIAQAWSVAEILRCHLECQGDG